LEVAIEDIENEQEVDTEILRVAESEVQRIKSIVSRLLDFARPSTNDMVDVDLPTLVNEVLALANKQLERMGVSLQTNLRPVAPLRGNPTQLKQVFLNLILNAMEAMPGGGRLAIEICPEEAGVTVVMSDDGVGMDEHTVEQIFEPFFSTKQEGTGLGLAVSYGIIQGHGGNINVESYPGGGSHFMIWLPYSR
jgi:two-component system NtrC family sensor kinase